MRTVCNRRNVTKWLPHEARPGWHRVRVPGGPTVLPAGAADVRLRSHRWRWLPGPREPILANLTPRQLRVVLTRAPDRYAADAHPGALEFRSDDAAATIRNLATRGYARCALVGGARFGLRPCLSGRTRFGTR